MKTDRPRRRPPIRPGRVVASVIAIVLALAWVFPASTTLPRSFAPARSGPPWA